MALPSITTIGSVLFLAYMFNSIWSIGKLYFPPKCDETLDSKMVSMLVQKSVLAWEFRNPSINYGYMSHGAYRV